MGLRRHYLHLHGFWRPCDGDAYHCCPLGAGARYQLFIALIFAVFDDFAAVVPITVALLGACSQYQLIRLRSFGGLSTVMPVIGVLLDAVLQFLLLVYVFTVMVDLATVVLIIVLHVYTSISVLSLARALTSCQHSARRGVATPGLLALCGSPPGFLT